MRHAHLLHCLRKIKIVSHLLQVYKSQTSELRYSLSATGRLRSTAQANP